MDCEEFQVVLAGDPRYGRHRRQLIYAGGGKRKPWNFDGSSGMSCGSLMTILRDFCSNVSMGCLPMR